MTPLPTKRYYVDTEFFEDGLTIELISIGVVCEDGREFYACNRDFDFGRYHVWSAKTGDRWLVHNVFPHLPEEGDPRWRTRAQIRAELLAFVGGDDPEFWGYFADYDWVGVCQLFGRMIDLPKGWPMFCRDVKQEQRRTLATLPKQAVGEHDALWDARWTRDAHNAVVTQEARSFQLPPAIQAELDYLRWFHREADFGPADGDVKCHMQARYERSGSRVPSGWRCE